MRALTPPRAWDGAADIEFWNRVSLYVDGTESGCWEWAGTRQSQGYGVFVYGGLRRMAHRDAYEWQYGPIPHGLVLDHLCVNPPCVRPDHLEPVTDAENTLRGRGMGARNARKNACHHGHPFTPENTYIHGGKRHCRECRRTTGREWYRNRKAQR
jgi:hypothetical protein